MLSVSSSPLASLPPNLGSTSKIQRSAFVLEMNGHRISPGNKY